MPRPQSRAEFIVDATLHGIGLAFGVAACGAMAAIATMRASPDLATRFIPYGIGLVAMFACSALYNLTRGRRWNPIFRRFDHAAIFLMIAGTYTPFSLAMTDRAWGLGLLAFVWAMALAGAAFKLLLPGRFERISVLLYLALGWAVLPAFGVLLSSIPGWAVALLVTGGALYTLGVLFHLWESLRFQNAIWHGFVLLAAVCHFGAVLVAA